MIAGIPGTGIGGIYYILLALLMPMHEACLMVNGSSSWRRWGMIGLQVIHALGILGSVYGTGWLIAQGVNAIRLHVLGSPLAGGGQLTNLVAATSAYMAILTLGGVLLLVYTLRWTVRPPVTPKPTE
ncbi:MAG: hypothetical protein FJ222_11645 [Lentisphaerae bacterium]|nr:hypothetical protein [Lentisphaerota bacterium]